MLVLGAGCSKEEPTSLPLSGDLSEECYRQLLADGILEGSDVSDPRDLSAVADAVFRKTGSQKELVNRFPPENFMNAPANEGYRIMAALFLEGALTNALTLNFDSAARHALADLAAGARVSTVRGPEHHTQLSTRNLIYLHRDIDSSPDELILRTEALQDAWRDQWEQVVAQRVLASPVVVFVGLGSPTSVLVETTRRIASAKGNPIGSVFVVDPSTPVDSRFASVLGVPPENYIRMGWGAFMSALSQRLVEEHRAAMVQDCTMLIAAKDIEAEDVSDICERLAESGILGLGQIRASWMLKNSSYQSYEDDLALHHFCDLILGIRTLERLSGRKAYFGVDGLVEFSLDGYPTRAIVCSGGGWMGMAKFQAELFRRREALQRQGRRPSFALVSGVEGGSELAPPTNIAANEEPDSLVTGPEHLRVFTLAQLRSNPDLVDEVFN